MTSVFLMHTWRARWRSLLVLAVMIGLTGGAASAAMAGARRSASSLDRFRDAANVLDVFVAGGLDENDGRQPPAFLELLDSPAVAMTNDLVFVFADDTYGFYFARTSTRGGDVESGILIEGRRADPDEPEEIVLTEASAARTGLGVGDTVEVPTITQAQSDALFDEGAPLAGLDGPVLALDVVGIVRNGFDLASTSEDTMLTILTPAFLDKYGGQVGLGAPSHMIRLADGADGIDEFTVAVEEAYGSTHLPSINVGQREEAVEDSIIVITVALAALGTLILLAGFVWITSAMARQQRLLMSDLEVLRALGSTTAVRRGVLLAAALPGVLLGVVVTPVVAVALSPLLPVGVARRIEPDPGLHADVPVLLVGVAALLLVLTTALALSATRLMDRGGRRVDARPLRVPRFVDRAARTLRPASGTGVRFALYAPAQASAPVRPALLGACVGVIGLVGVAVIGANAQRLIDTPARWGTPWDMTVARFDQETFSQPEVTDEDRELLLDNPDIEAAGILLHDEQVTIDGVEAIAMTLETVKGDLTPTVVGGREPRAPDEVAVGADTLAATGGSIGSTVTIASRSQVSEQFRIVGVFAYPMLTDPGPLGIGVSFTADGGRRLKLGDTTLSDDAGTSYAVIRWRDGVDERAALQRLGDQAAIQIGPTRPPEIRGLDDVEGFPLLAASALAVLGVIATTHALVVTVHRRRRELGVLSALGFAPRQRRLVILVQATTIAIVAVGVGVPIGAVVGRLTWAAIATALGVSDDAAYPLGVIVLGAVGLVVVLNLIAAWPAHAARRLQVASALRSE